MKSERMGEVRLPVRGRVKMSLISIFGKILVAAIIALAATAFISAQSLGGAVPTKTAVACAPPQQCLFIIF